MDPKDGAEKRVRVRFAPSPTGALHIGGVRTALYNYLFAKKMGGDFILRIEDTDQHRTVSGAEEYIVEALNWCGIHIDEGFTVGGPHAPYKQSDRKDLYRSYAEQLVLSGHAYYAFDTPEELDVMRETLSQSGQAAPQYNYITRESMRNSLTLPAQEVEELNARRVPSVIRIKIPRKEEIRVIDQIRGLVVVHSSQMDDKVLFKSDGMPTYHLANVVDDYLMAITHVIRGEEWLPSAPLHVLLYRYLGWEASMPLFAHLPLLLKPEGNGKLSKRDGDRLGFPVFPLQWRDPVTQEVSSGYREKGYFPEALVNFLALLGWNPGSNQEIYSMNELIAAFSLERISKSGAKFDLHKALWFNHQYLKNQPDEALARTFYEEIEPRYPQAPFSKLVQIIRLIKEKANFTHEFWALSSFFFEPPSAYDQVTIDKKWNEGSARFIGQFLEGLHRLVPFHKEEVESIFQATAESLHEKPGSFMQITRVCLTGINVGPALFETMEVLGLSDTVSRLNAALETLPTYG